MICANGPQLNILFHPLVIHMMKTRLDSQVAAKLTVKLCNVVQACYDSLSTWVYMYVHQWSTSTLSTNQSMTIT